MLHLGETSKVCGKQGSVQHDVLIYHDLNFKRGKVRNINLARLQFLFQNVEYVNHDGKIRKSRLNLSGFWGVARHMYYVFEIMLAMSWSLPAIHYGITPFFYVIFLVILLIHRTFRDEEKCSNKYGDGWKLYCEKVPYRYIPGIF